MQLPFHLPSIPVPAISVPAVHLPHLLGAAALTCTPVPGAEAVFANADTQFVWVGETHGTAEQPLLFADLVCLAAQKRPVVVALEREVSEQPLWDAFLKSDGGPKAQAALLQGANWSQVTQDGRSSQAMLALAERLRRLYAAHRIRGVELIIRSPPSGQEPPDEHESRMAQAVYKASLGLRPPLVMAFSGNAHASRRRNTFRGQTYDEAANHLPKAATVSVFLRGGEGQAWNCKADGCRPHDYRWPGAKPRGVSPAPAEIEGFDFVADTGEPTTASLPAARPADPVALPAAGPAKPAGA